VADPKRSCRKAVETSVSRTEGAQSLAPALMACLRPGQIASKVGKLRPARCRALPEDIGSVPMILLASAVDTILGPSN
jgi:hypothetical protein